MVKFLSREELEKLNTKRLLAYKNKLMKVPEESKDSWGMENINCLSKQSPEWQAQYALVKEILATREHVQR